MARIGSQEPPGGWKESPHKNSPAWFLVLVAVQKIAQQPAPVLGRLAEILLLSPNLRQDANLRRTGNPTFGTPPARGTLTTTIQFVTFGLLHRQTIEFRASCRGVTKACAPTAADNTETHKKKHEQSVHEETSEATAQGVILHQQGHQHRTRESLEALMPRELQGTH